MSEPAIPSESIGAGGFPSAAPDAPDAPTAAQMSDGAIRQTVAALFAHRDSTDRAKMLPMKQQQIEALLDRQAVLMQALAFVLDDVLRRRGCVPAVKFEARVSGGNGNESRPTLVRP